MNRNEGEEVTACVAHTARATLALYLHAFSAHSTGRSCGHPNHASPPRQLRTCSIVQGETCSAHHHRDSLFLFVLLLAKLTLQQGSRVTIGLIVKDRA